MSLASSFSFCSSLKIVFLLLINVLRDKKEKWKENSFPLALVCLLLAHSLLLARLFVHLHSYFMMLFKWFFTTRPQWLMLVNVCKVSDEGLIIINQILTRFPTLLAKQTMLRQALKKTYDFNLTSECKSNPVESLKHFQSCLEL